MRIFLMAVLAGGLQLGALAGVDAQGTMNGVSHGQGAAKARCSPGDPNVMVDQKTKMYTMDSSAPAPKKGAGGAPPPSSMTGSMSGMSGMSSAGKSGMVSMCKSEAMSMGAKMAAKSK